MATKSLILGTAQWGWTVSPETAFDLLDAWLAAGQRRVDCATNYPINRNPADFRAAEGILCDYIHAHGLHDLEVTMKIGSLDNMRSPEANLAPSFVQMMAGEYHRLLGDNLGCLMLHWDNRADAAEIAATLDALARLHADTGVRPGLSGIKHPEVYGAVVGRTGLAFDIQLKHNLLYTDLPRYLPHFDPAIHRYCAYGINAGGLKLPGSQYEAGSTFLARGGQTEAAEALLQRLTTLLPAFNARHDRPAITTMNQLGLIYAGLNPAIQAVLLGVSSVTQLEDSVGFWAALEGYGEVYAGLVGALGQ